MNLKKERENSLKVYQDTLEKYDFYECPKRALSAACRDIVVLQEMVDELVLAWEAQQRKIDELVKALSFYADENNWYKTIKLPNVTLDTSKVTKVAKECLNKLDEGSYG